MRIFSSSNEKIVFSRHLRLIHDWFGTSRRWWPTVAIIWISKCIDSVCAFIASFAWDVRKSDIIRVLDFFVILSIWFSSSCCSRCSHLEITNCTNDLNQTETRSFIYIISTNRKLSVIFLNKSTFESIFSFDAETPLYHPTRSLWMELKLVDRAWINLKCKSDIWMWLDHRRKESTNINSNACQISPKLFTVASTSTPHLNRTLFVRNKHRTKLYDRKRPMCALTYVTE